MIALVRDFTCAVCGAPRSTVERALVVLCRHCGALVAQADGVTIAEQHAAGIQRLVKPTAAEARLTAVTLAMSGAIEREAWRLLCEEQVLLMAIVHPGHVAPLPAASSRRVAHVAEHVLLSELATFEPAIRAHLATYSAAAAKLTDEPMAAARAMLVAARAYFAALLAHPDLPPGVLREGATHHAREMVRAAVRGYASLLGVGVLDEIRIELLGDEEGATCARCGAPLAGDGPVACLHCGAVTTLTSNDTWLTAQLDLWAITRADLVRRGDLDGAGPVIAALGGFLWTTHVPAASAAMFLRRAVPWLSRDDLAAGLDLAGRAANADQRALLGALAGELADWTPEPTQRPAPRVAPSALAFPPPTPEDEAAWLESALALHRLRGGPLSELLARCLSTMQVAAIHEAPTGLSPAAAMTFFERAAPAYDRAAMLALLGPLLPAYDHPRVHAFTTELARLLAAG